MLRQKCLDVLKVRRRHPFLASGTFSSAWRLEQKTNKASYASSQMQINPRRESDGDFCLPKKFKFRYMGLIHIKKRRGLLLKNQLLCALFFIS